MCEQCPPIPCHAEGLGCRALATSAVVDLVTHTTLAYCEMHANMRINASQN